MLESGVFATLWAGEGLVHACPQGEVVDALLAVVMTAREHLWLCVVLMTDGTGDLFLQIFDTFFHHVFVFSHSLVSRGTPFVGSYRVCIWAPFLFFGNSLQRAVSVAFKHSVILNTLHKQEISRDYIPLTVTNLFIKAS